MNEVKRMSLSVMTTELSTSEMEMIQAGSGINLKCAWIAYAAGLGSIETGFISLGVMGATYVGCILW